MYRSFDGSHGLGSRDFGVEYAELLDELTSRIRTLANVTDGRLNVGDSFGLVLLLNRFEAGAIVALFIDLFSADDDFTGGDFFVSAVSFGLSQRLE